MDRTKMEENPSNSSSKTNGKTDQDADIHKVERSFCSLDMLLCL